MRLWVALLVLAGAGHAQQGCAVSKDLVVRALELVSASPARDELSNGLMLLKQAEESCDENGDAWYYRALFERKLGQGAPQYSLGKARERNAPALRDAEDPFTLATPARGVAVVAHDSPAPGTGSRPTRDIHDPAVSHKWALVVGVGQFHNPRLNLKYTRNDAQSVAELLRDPTYGRFRADHVRLIADAEATAVNIRAGLNWLVRNSTEDDLAVVYIATHGTAREQDAAGASYVVACDTDVDSLDGLYSTAIPMVEITTVVRTRIKALKVAVILDTCHSQGALAQTVTIPQSVSSQTVNHIREGTGRVILAASRTEESSYESAKYSHGLFTYYLLSALKQQKEAPLDKIYQWVAAQVAREAEANGWKQHPVFGASDEASPIVLGISPLEAIGWVRPNTSPTPAPAWRVWLSCW
ncbi:MAG: caspase domain-containing protein [Bryobacteraceae bacterium]